MKTKLVCITLFIFLWIGLLWASVDPPQLTIERIKIKLADLQLENDLLREYNQKLITENSTLEAELKKLKEIKP